MIKKIYTVLFAVFFAPMVTFSQNLTIDEAVSESVKYFSTKLKAGTKVIVLNVESESKNLSDYIIEETNTFIMNDTKLSPVVNRSGLSNVLKEKNINDLNEIGETMAVQIGKEIGTSSVILGSISKLGEIYRFRIQALNTADGQILGIQSLNVRQDDVLADLLKGGKTSAKPEQTIISEEATTPDETIDETDDSQNANANARARLEAKMESRSVSAPQNAKTHEENPNITRAAADKKDDGKSYFLLSIKFQQFNNYYPSDNSTYLYPYESNSVFPGSFNLEIGGIQYNEGKGNTVIGLTDWGPGLFGAGVFLGRTTLKSKIFRFRYGVDFGFWGIITQTLEVSSIGNIAYGRLRENAMFGGPHINFLLGYNPVYFSFGLKTYFGSYSEYDMKLWHASEGSLNLTENKTGFTAMPVINIGLTFTF
ncbi:MAG: CsgG/HfaB family protein [Chitinivibrionia bacterium]|nr:CsgG/HfaB family protein [Chitinivibrionia bacterium]